MSATMRILLFVSLSICIFTATYALAHSYELNLNQIVVCLIAYLIGLGIMILTPIYAALDGLADGETFEGPYQQMTPEQKEKLKDILTREKKKLKEIQDKYNKKKKVVINKTIKKNNLTSIMAM